MQVLGEFLRWTIKQFPPEELKRNYGNIKTVFRRVQSYVSHPDPRRKAIGLLGLKELVAATLKE
jgi:hypothetical protein